MNLNLLFQLAMSGFLMGGVYSLIALGLSLIFGVLRVINFAHGEMMVWGMYIAYIPYRRGRFLKDWASQLRAIRSVAANRTQLHCVALSARRGPQCA